MPLVAPDDGEIAFISGSSTTKLTTDDCSPNLVQYVYDANGIANVVGKAIIQNGGDSWFFITVDYAFGLSLEAETTKVINAANGKVIGSVKHPLTASDFSSAILQAQASGAKVIALANAGIDMINAIKAAKEFAIGPEQNVVSLISSITDISSLGLDNANQRARSRSCCDGFSRP